MMLSNCPKAYRVFENWGLTQFQTTFSGLTPNQEYMVKPLVKLLGMDIMASPCETFHTKDCPVTLSDFRVTNKQHKDNGFTHNGKQYDYRFDVAVTANLGDGAEEIVDWGYMYQDPFGNPPAQISLKNYGSSYTDTRWAYFRNEPISTCTLYGYVKYVGSDEIVYGEPQDFPLEYGETSCPDSNHPHWIDLGLPSGTQWRCCNEGASAPEAYGGYYAFGQVSSAPTKEQIQELLDYCSSEWTTLNGVNGRKFTGPNGGTIFLPAAGWRGGEVYLVGDTGYYWSSTPSGEYNAYELNVHSGDAYWYSGNNRRSERSVRPVR